MLRLQVAKRFPGKSIEPTDSAGKQFSIGGFVKSFVVELLALQVILRRKMPQLARLRVKPEDAGIGRKPKLSFIVLLDAIHDVGSKSVRFVVNRHRFVGE